jgi:hypothetical protein
MATKQLVVHFRVFCNQTSKKRLKSRVKELISSTDEGCRLFGLAATLKTTKFLKPRAVTPGTSKDHQKAVVMDLVGAYRDTDKRIRPDDICAFLLEIGTDDGLWAKGGGNNVLIDISHDSCDWVLAHEIGHLVGIAGHDELPAQIMYSSPCNIGANGPPATFTVYEQDLLLKSSCAQELP